MNNLTLKKILCLSASFILLFYCLHKCNKINNEDEILPVSGVEICDFVLKTSFDEPNIHKLWIGSHNRAITFSDGTLCVSLPEKGIKLNAWVLQKIPVEQLRGTRVQITGQIKAENVKEPPFHYNGIKMMLILDTPSGTKWLHRDSIWGTFDWKKVDFIASVPANITDAKLQLGIENTTGTVWFDDITLKIIGKIDDETSGFHI